MCLEGFKHQLWLQRFWFIEHRRSGLRHQFHTDLATQMRIRARQFQPGRCDKSKRLLQQWQVGHQTVTQCAGKCDPMLQNRSQKPRKHGVFLKKPQQTRPVLKGADKGVIGVMRARQHHGPSQPRVAKDLKFRRQDLHGHIA